MTCIRPSYCYARQKCGLSISTGSFIALISKSNAVGLRMNHSEWTNVAFPTRSWRHVVLLVVTSFFHLLPVFLNFSFLPRQYSQVMRAVLCLHGCIFFKSQNKQHAYLSYVRKMQNVCFIWAILKQITECDFEKVWKCRAFTLMKFK